MTARAPLKVALVVFRYGVEVGGGAETLARLLAELLNDAIQLTVLTTCALDYLTWADHYPPGETEVNGVRVRRFSVPRPRDISAFGRVSARAYGRPEDLELGRTWMEQQGPVAPELLEHLEASGDDYDVVVFMTYLYATTMFGLPLVADRSVLVPTVHDEPPLRLRIFDKVFAAPRALVFSTPEEQELAEWRFGVERERCRVIGVGVDAPPATDPERFAAAHGITRPYALYVGRLDTSKGVGTLIGAHRTYRAASPDGLDLVLVGRGALDAPPADWLHLTGFVSEREKHDAVAGAAVVVMPSPYESLSFALLEAWSHARPTVANADSPVLVGQSRRSGGGLWYRDEAEYAVMIDLLARDLPLAAAIGRQGQRHSLATYSWARVRERWLDVLVHVARGGGAVAAHETVPERVRESEAEVPSSSELEAQPRESPSFDYNSAFDACAVIRRHARPDVSPHPMFLTNYLGVRIDPKFLPRILQGRAGEVEGVPIPANWHADIAEWAAALRAVDLARRTFTIAELGCGWGCWMNNTGVAARRAGLEVHLIGIEGDEGHIAFAREACAVNEFAPEQVVFHHGIAAATSGTALFPRQDVSGEEWGLEPIFDAGRKERAEAVASGRFVELPMVSLSDVIGEHPRLDLLHVDIQGGEADLVESCGSVLDERVAYLVIGTHSREIEGRLFSNLLGSKWRLEIERPAILSLNSSGPSTTVDGVQGWRNLDLLPDDPLKRARRALIRRTGRRRAREGGLRPTERQASRSPHVSTEAPVGTRG